MNIYIYGGTSFTQEIHKVLDHGNIKFKIDDGQILEVGSLEKLKVLIKTEPYEIFLIDQNLIIEDDFVSKYLKFLVPKNGIKKTFLDKYGIGDISFRTYDDLNIYITKRLETAIRKPKAKEITTIEDMFEAFEYDDEDEPKTIEEETEELEESTETENTTEENENIDTQEDEANSDDTSKEDKEIEESTEPVEIEEETISQDEKDKKDD